MKLNFQPGQPPSSLAPPALRAPHSVRAFTMVEIALSLAIIGFALVAIIGVLPAGMTVQKDNREQTVINLDAAFLMDAIRSGARGQDDLVSFVTNITIVTTTYDSTGVPVSSNSVPYGSSQLVSGSNILGLLTTPKYIPLPGGGFVSNSVTAFCRAINGPAVDQGASQTAKDFAFQYQVTVEVIPSAQYAYLAPNGGNWVNVTAPGIITASNAPSLDSAIAQHLQPNLNEIRLSYRWPLLPGQGNKLGGGRQVFRSSAAGQIINIPATPYYFIQPLAYKP